MLCGWKIYKCNVTFGNDIIGSGHVSVDSFVNFLVMYFVKKISCLLNRYIYRSR